MKKWQYVVILIHTVSLVLLVCGSLVFEQYSHKYFVVLLAYAIKCFAETISGVKSLSTAMEKRE